MHIPSYTLRSTLIILPSASEVCISSHSMFANADVLGNIASLVDVPSLAYFILVDSRCFDAGKRYIWEIVPTAFYVLKLLPFFTLRDGTWSVPMSANPASWEWSRFDLYAPDIRRMISLSSSSIIGDHDIDAKTFLNISYLRPDKFADAPIFPKLQSLIFRGSGLYTNTGPGNIRYLCTDRLEEAEIHVHNFAMLTYLRNLLPSVASLTKLTLVGRISASVLQTLGKFSNVKSLTIAAVYSTPEVKRTLSPLICDFFESFPSHMSPEHLVLRAYVPRMLSFETLSCVKYLELEDNSSTILHVLQAGSFDRVSLKFTEVELISSFHACFEALAKWSSRTLQTVTISSRAELKHDFPALHCLNPLLEVPNLQELCVLHSDKLNIILGDEDLSRIAAAWPSLRRLNLLPSPLSTAYRDVRQQCEPKICP
ncbi:hypothetical protein CPB83DRAFT_900958 [Crepidotus variabilis]|uniref:Uncharacterized protein n=1 Tax=Crepidotus variabilis TaxID=179855 RepID=A0A9P6E057_9AGAR|nr:hypothetical protein CPB83DRAFT_900958 [Crepidotus variabilis]